MCVCVCLCVCVSVCIFVSVSAEKFVVEVRCDLYEHGAKSLGYLFATWYTSNVS